MTTAKKKTVTIPLKEYNLLKQRVADYDKLRNKIEKAQGEWDDEKEEFNENAETDLCTIGEICLDHFNLWL